MSSHYGQRQILAQGIFSRRTRRLFLGVFIVFISETLNLHLRTDQPKKAHVVVYKVKDRFCLSKALSVFFFSFYEILINEFGSAF